jgi:putative endonuclease
MARVDRTYHVYILASRSRNLYTGVTDDLERRLIEHRKGSANSFTQRYRIRRLIYCEPFSAARDAIAREKQIKAWRRGKKIALIEASNPTWADLAETLFSWSVKEQQIPRRSAHTPRDGSG